jgi:N-[(2S)-2-amino-2-carboxyethyl]-L-glutamate dehydrogenase
MQVMSGGDSTILTAPEVGALPAGREAEVIAAVQAAYEAHAVGESALPHSSSLHFPENAGDRIIALPAYLGGGFDVAGMKWIASFPGNRAAGLERASAVVIVNSARTGRPEAILEGSIISAQRTAACAALAARHLHREEGVTRVGLIGCGLINEQIVRFLRVVFPRIRVLTVFDTLEGQVGYPRAGVFGEGCEERFPGVEVVLGRDVNDVLENASLISLATTAGEPHIHDLSCCAPGSTLLHISLRDLAPQVMLSHDNIVDDADHVCRAATSVHLAEQLIGHRRFIRCTLADITRGLAPARVAADDIAIFSPFGLGVLDLAVSKLVLDRARAEGRGTIVRSFLPGRVPGTPGVSCEQEEGRQDHLSRREPALSSVRR